MNLGMSDQTDGMSVLDGRDTRRIRQWDIIKGLLSGREPVEMEHGTWICETFGTGHGRE